ncbi:Pr6Pr family membrane protein [Arsenicicoccus bolidensis]|uniref:Pr6Pr family membrane protein n=1 Tax=Arsenicicoccus bolidensis TaxID=229480 RepID=UPI0028B16539|nr:Pr6Pr family membrane protein [Arsenicicoccus bolidensis]
MKTPLRTPLAVLVMVVELVGIVCQFAQHTDSTPPLTYFTVDCAVLAVIAAAATLIRPEHRLTRWLRGTATTGVIVSGLIYALVIAPATPTGSWIQPWDDTLVRISTIVLHGVAPVLMLCFYLADPVAVRGKELLVHAASWLAWPAAYLIVISGGAALGAWTIPYPFLRPSESGWGPVLGAVVGMAVILFTVGVALLWVGHRVRGGLGRRRSVAA